MNSSRLRRLVATAALSVAAAVGLSTVGAGSASAATGTDLASQITANQIPYSLFTLAGASITNSGVAYPADWGSDSQLNTFPTYDPNHWGSPSSRFFLVPDGSVIGKTVTSPSPGVTLTSAKFYPTYRVMSFDIRPVGNQRSLANPMCLDAFGGAGTPGTPVGAYTCDPNADHQANQLWLRIPDPSTPNVYSFVNLDGLNRTGYVNTAPRLSIPDPLQFGQPQGATLQAPGSGGIQRFAEADYPITNLPTG